MGQSLFKKHSKFQNYDEIFYCGMTQVSNTNLDVLIQCQYTTIWRNKNTRQSLIKKHSKFLNIDEIFYCDMTRLRNRILNYCGLCQYVKPVNPKKVSIRSSFKNYLKFWKFQYLMKIFTATLPKVGTSNSTFSENIKVFVRKNTMRQGNFRKCSRYHRFSKIIQSVISRRRNTNSGIFVKRLILIMKNIGQIDHKHKISVKDLIVTWPKHQNKISRKNHYQS